MEAINFSDFEKIELRVGTIIKAEAFEGLRKPAYKVWVDFGEFGEKKTSAQITDLYKTEDLIGTQIIGVINFPAKQIKDFMSEFLLTGFEDAEGRIVIARPEFKVPNGSKLC